MARGDSDENGAVEHVMDAPRLHGIGGTLACIEDIAARGADDFLVGGLRCASANGLVYVISGKSRTPTRVLNGG